MLVKDDVKMNVKTDVEPMFQNYSNDISISFDDIANDLNNREKETSVVVKLHNMLPEGVCCYWKNDNTIRIEGFRWEIENSERVNPFANESQLLEAIRTTKEENPSVTLEIRPSWGVRKQSDGVIYVQESEGGEFKPISNEFEKYAVILYGGIEIEKTPLATKDNYLLNRNKRDDFENSKVFGKTNENITLKEETPSKEDNSFDEVLLN